MKLKTVYICRNCQFENQKWTGKCPECFAWNSFEEDIVEKQSTLSLNPRKIQTVSPSILNDSMGLKKRISSNIQEFDRVIGNGIVPGSLTLLSGEPGIGKSTLTLQIASKLAENNKVLIISGEESIEQIANRAGRLNLNQKNLQALNELKLEIILETLKQEKPSIAIIDSIQVISSLDLPSGAGSITQVRYCTEKIMELAKTTRTPIILIGHVTKDGNLAGPRVLEHLVDTVLHLEGDRYQNLRLLRAVKNRFGSCNEVGIFEMTENGMEEVNNPSEQLLEGRKENAIGSAITVSMEGTRPMLIEVQALVSVSPFGYPKRTANGFDLNRLQILIAVLEKYAKLNLQNQDVFINVVGGIKLKEPATDLAVLMAIASSLLKKPIPRFSAIFAEVGLSGELRKVSHSEKRQIEASKLGFKDFIDPTKYKEVEAVVKTLRTS
ncbi:DNA repair protein RadA [Candidatus Peregrinibacteria bacterium]|nr:DNA repair protein RadA [Candidatus Peregrinibacteria bacterium]